MYKNKNEKQKIKLYTKYIIYEYFMGEIQTPMLNFYIDIINNDLLSNL